MSDRVFARASIELEHFVTGINSSVPARNGVAEAAVPWSRNHVRFRQNQIPDLKRQTMNVLLSRALFVDDAPDWAPLPVGDEIPPLLGTTGPMHLLGLYAASLKAAGYNFLQHPTFNVFGCGVMAHPCAPGHVRNDQELRCEFPARELPGLCCELIWHGQDLPDDLREELVLRDRVVDIWLNQ
jgi:hypothetical protein